MISQGLLVAAHPIDLLTSSMVEVIASTPMIDTAQPAEIQAGAVHRFFEDFDAAFASFDGAVIALRYAEPYLACRADGSSETLPDAATTGQYFDRIVTGYHELGVRSCTHRDLEITDVGGRHTLATVTWDLLDDGGVAVVTWRESYLLVDEAGELLVRTSIDFAESGT